jgi:ketosteroid isomerase-like protein
MCAAPNGSVEALAARIRGALECADLSQFGELLDPNVRWGAPDDPAPSCQSRNDVMAWYGRGRAAGRRARVVDLDVYGDKILVHLTVADPAPPGSPVVEQDRWQVLTCARGRVVDIRGFETSDEAFARVLPRR